MGSKREHEPGAVRGTDTPPAQTSAQDRHKPRRRAQKGKGGAPKGNVNAMKHGAFLNAARRGARALRDRFRRRGEREALQILKGLKLEGNPLARVVARQMGRLEAKVARLESYHDSRGHFTKGGELKASVATELGAINDILAEARRLLEGLEKLSPTSKFPPDCVFTVTREGSERELNVNPRPGGPDEGEAASPPEPEPKVEAEPVAPPPPKPSTPAAPARGLGDKSQVVTTSEEALELGWQTIW